MFLHAALMRRAAEARPVRVALIGAGKFGAMFLAQVPTTPGLIVSVIADLRPDAARATCKTVGWPEARVSATAFTDSAAEAIARDDVDVVVEATGHPRAGIAHARMAFAAGKHVVMVNVEADVLAGAALAREAASAGVVYSMAYGDQPALTCEMVDWARSCGFEVIAAGKGTKYLPSYHASTPATVWQHYGLTAEQARDAGMNPKMFNSFLDGTKSALEMAAIANACDLACPEDGLLFPPCGADDLAHVLRPKAEGGVLAGKGMVEVVSSLERDGRPVPRDLRWGVYVVIEAPTRYAAACFRQYGMNTDHSGHYSAMYKPFHLIGLELNISILAAALLGQATGSTKAFRGDVVAVAKRDLAEGEVLDGEGGATVWGKLVPAARSVREGGCPIGLAQDAALRRPIKAGEMVRMADLTLDPADPVLALRAGMTPG
jgi:predicted homoserine dehydrogenase-like protein